MRDGDFDGLLAVLDHDELYSVMSFTVRRGRLVASDILVDPERLSGPDLSAIVQVPE